MNTFPRMHISLYVSNIENTVKFYESFFGVSASKVKGDYTKFIIEKPSLIISFVLNEGKVSPNFGHLGFQVETKEELYTKMAQAKENDQVYLEELGANCCYATQDKYWSKDPDGHMWEVYYFHEDAEFNDPRYGNESAEACCTPTKPMVALSDINIIGQDSCETDSECC